MIQVFKTDEDYKKWMDGQRLPSGIVVYVSDDETMYFSTNNIKGELKTYECKKEEVIQYPPLVYSAKSAGSRITVNGQSMTLEQGDNMVLEYPTAITSVEATDNEELTYLQIPNTVTSINDNAFGGCVALASVSLPDSLTSIGVGAFQSCIGLTSINIPSGVTSISMETFNGCSALASVTLPEGLTNIGSSTFMDCTSLTSITIPSSVEMIDFEAFNYCEALTDFNFNGTMEQWGAITLGDDWNLNAAFTVVHCTDGDVSLEEVIQYPPLVYSAKSAGSKLTVNGETVTLAKGNNITLDYPNEITSVAATNNTALTDIQIPNTVTSIGERAFRACSELQYVTIPNTVTSLDEYAFANCDNLASAVIPNSVKSIGSLAFMSCTSLAYVKLPESDISFGIGAFMGCTALYSITIPEGITSISDNFCQDCSNLESVNIPSSLKKIGHIAFKNCGRLTKVNYNGTMEQWKAISRGNNWHDNTPLTVVHCTDGDVSLQYPPLIYSANAAGSRIRVNGETVTLAKGNNITLDYHNEIKSVIATDNTALTDIQIPNTVTEIEWQAFSGCSSLVSVNIPDTVTSIGASSFLNCYALTDFRFNGTMEQWEAISFGGSWNENATFLVVYCTDGEVNIL